MINLSIWLYGKPAWDLDIENEENIDAELLRAHASDLKNHLETVADIIEKLQAAKWNCTGTLYTLECYKGNINTKNDIKKELKKLEIDPGLVQIEEYKEEEEQSQNQPLPLKRLRPSKERICSSLLNVSKK